MAGKHEGTNQPPLHLGDSLRPLLLLSDEWPTEDFQVLLIGYEVIHGSVFVPRTNGREDLMLASVDGPGDLLTQRPETHITNFRMCHNSKRQMHRPR